MNKPMFIGGIILFIIGIILTGLFIGAVDACQGTVAKVAGFFNPGTKAGCTTYYFFLIVGLGAIIVGIILVIVGLILKGASKKD